VETPGGSEPDGSAARSAPKLLRALSSGLDAAAVVAPVPYGRALRATLAGAAALGLGEEQEVRVHALLDALLKGT